MASKQLSLRILCLLLTFCCQQILGQDDPDAQQLQALRPRGRIRIADMQMPQAPPPPAPPMLGHGPINWPSYGPAVPNAIPAPGAMPMPASSTVHTHIPLLREQLESNTPSEGRIQDAVVYGNWKAEHPQIPDVGEEPPKQRKYGRLEAMLMGMPAEGKLKT